MNQQAQVRYPDDPRELNYRVRYRDFTIAAKRDFGKGNFHLIDGMPCAWGYVVTDGGIVNVIPGAGWFQTVADAKLGIDAMHDVGGAKAPTSDHEWQQAFHERYRALKKAQAAGPDLLAFAQAYIEMANDVTARGSQARPTFAQLNALLEQARTAIAKARGNEETT